MAYAWNPFALCGSKMRVLPFALSVLLFFRCARQELPTSALALSELIAGLALCHASLCHSRKAAAEAVGEILACHWHLCCCAVRIKKGADYCGCSSPKNIHWPEDQPRILASTLLTACVWVLLAFSLCFGATLGPVGDPGSFPALQNLAEEDWHDVPFYATFFLVAPLLAKGMIVPRLPLLRSCAFTLLWAASVFAPLCHGMWGGGWQAQWGVADFAGGRRWRLILISLDCISRRSP